MDTVIDIYCLFCTEKDSGAIKKQGWYSQMLGPKTKPAFLDMALTLKQL